VTLDVTRLATDPEPLRELATHARPREPEQLLASELLWTKYSLPLLLPPVKEGVLTLFYEKSASFIPRR
jgi:hypothetical protein